MSSKNYETLTKACFLIAIAASMLYGKLGTLNWVAIASGVVAAAAAVSTYFYNAHRLREPEATASLEVSQSERARVVEAVAAGMARSAVAMTATNEVVAKTAVVVGAQASFWDEDAFKVREVDLDHYQQVLENFQHIVIRRVTKPSPIRERQIFLDEVVQLVNRLSSTCEVQVNLKDRHLTIRPAHPGRARTIPELHDEVEPVDLRLHGNAPSRIIH